MNAVRKILTHWSAATVSRPRSILTIALLCNCVLTFFFFLNLESFSFDEPLRGFEARGSSLANRINSWKLIAGKTNSPDDFISLYPRRPDSNVSIAIATDDSVIDEEEEMEKRRIAAVRTEQQLKRHGARNRHLSSTSPAFCSPLTDSYIQFVVEPRDEAGDMFSLEYLQDMCEMDKRLRSLDQFTSRCVARDGEDVCCSSWSLPNLVARFNNKTSCYNLTVIDVIAVRELLDSCSEDYRRKSLHLSCSDDPKSCPQVPPRCYANQNLVFELLNYILDGEFVEHDPLTTGKLARANIFLPVAKSSNLLPLFHELSSILSSPELLVRIASFDIGLKDTLFQKLLVQDTKFLVMAYLTVLLIVWIYTKSFWITIVTSMNIAAALGAATAIYKFIYGIVFFPFMNLMTVVLLIAVGTDSTFIFVAVWEREAGMKSRRSLEDHVNCFFRRTLLSTLLSNGTTCLALISSLISDITSLKCFAVFSATAIIVLYIMSIVTIPTLLVMTSQPEPVPDTDLVLRFKSVCRTLGNMLYRLIHYLRFLLTIAMFLAMVGAAVLLVQHFRLPDSDHFSIFHSNHPFETFDTRYRDLFKFSHRISEEDGAYGFPITIVFGIKAGDNGDYLDPFSRGSLELDPEFDPASPSSQQWMLKLCQNLRNVSFYKPTHGPLLSNCFIETFKTWIEGRPCFDHIMNKSNIPCCNQTPFPYDRWVFDACVPQAIDVFHRTPTFVISREGPGVRFSKHSSHVVAVIIQYSTNFTFSNSYSGMKTVVDQIEHWMTGVLSGAPPGIRTGFFVSENLELLALQQSLVNGTIYCIIVALVLAFVSIVLVTRSLLLTSAALLTITGIMTATLATLVLCFEWQANVIESVAIVVAVGISVDLPLHYIIAFQRQEAENLSNKTLTSLSEIGAPLLAASVTTALAGLWMTCSQILAYIRVGSFLLVISSFNVLFTFLFLTCLLLLIQNKAHSSSRQSQIEFLRNDLPLSDY